MEKTRIEIDDKYKWDLNALYDSEKTYEDSFSKLDEL